MFEGTPSHLSPHETKEPWTKDREELAKGIRDEAKQASDVHRKSAHAAERKHKLLSVLAIIFPAILMVTSENDNVCTKNSTKNALILGFNKILLLFNTILSGVILFCKSAEKKAAHELFSSEYAKLARRISAELKKPEEFRDGVAVFLARVGEQYNNLEDHAPATPEDGFEESSEDDIEENSESSQPAITHHYNMIHHKAKPLLAVDSAANMAQTRTATAACGPRV